MYINIIVLQTLLSKRNGKTTQFVYCAREKVFNYVILKKTVSAAAGEIGTFLLLSFTPLHTSPLPFQLAPCSHHIVYSRFGEQGKELLKIYLKVSRKITLSILFYHHKIYTSCLARQDIIIHEPL